MSTKNISFRLSEPELIAKLTELQDACRMNQTEVFKALLRYSAVTYVSFPVPGATIPVYREPPTGK